MVYFNTEPFPLKLHIFLEIINFAAYFKVWSNYFGLHPRIFRQPEGRGIEACIAGYTFLTWHCNTNNQIGPMGLMGATFTPTVMNYVDLPNIKYKYT